VLQIIKTPITQDEFVQEIQALCPGRFSDPGLIVLFHYLNVEKKPWFGESEVYFPDVCESSFQESSPAQLSAEVRKLLVLNPDTDMASIVEIVKRDLGEQFIGATDTTVVWWNG
jgi:hypothetical protein